VSDRHDRALRRLVRRNNGNLTEDARCWQTAPTETSDLGVLVLGPCVACRLEQ
jgi:hypothetical protein